MMQRYSLGSPYHYGEWVLKNGGLSKTFIDWRFNLPYQLALAIRRREMFCPSMLYTVALFAGAYSRLWVNGLMGRLVPMDVQPEGWTYQNGDVAEASFFWQWVPNEDSEQRMLSIINQEFSLESLMSDSPLKSLTPMKLQEKHGEVQGVEAIPLSMLPGLMHQGEWFLEIE